MRRSPVARDDRARTSSRPPRHPEVRPMVDQPDPIQRAVLPIPQQRPARARGVRREGSQRDVPADRAAAAAGRSAQRPDRAARRRRLRRLQRLRRAVQHADVREARGERPQVQPLPHHGALLAHPPGAADGPQPPLRRHGRHHGDRHLRAGLQLDPPRQHGPAGGDAQAQRLLHRAVRQVPRGARVGDEPDRARSTPGPPAPASSTSTASSAARPTSTRRRSTRTPCRSSPTARRRRATTSRRT